MSQMLFCSLNQVSFRDNGRNPMELKKGYEAFKPWIDEGILTWRKFSFEFDKGSGNLFNFFIFYLRIDFFVSIHF